MTKRERVERVFSGEALGSVPSCFSLHFTESEKYGDEAVKAHLKFFKDTDTDIIKIMNENAFPSNPNVFEAEDYKRIKVQGRNSDFVQKEVELVKRILDKADPDAYPICTIQGAVASLGHSMRPQYIPLSEIRALETRFYRENSSVVKDALDKISDSLCYLVEEVVKAGCKGIFYAVLGGEKNLWTKEESEDVEMPYDIKVLKAAREAGAKSILHLCKKDLDIDRFVPYSPYVDAVNWGVYENDISLEEGVRLFPGKVILGGLEHRGGLLEKGSIEEIDEEVKSLKRRMSGIPYILGADCTLSTDQDRSKIKAAVIAARE